MNKLRSVTNKVVSWFSVIGAVLMFAVIMLILVNIFMRRVLGKTIMGTTEYVGYFMCVAASLGLMQTELYDANVRVTVVLDLLRDKVSLRSYGILDLICYIITALGFIPMTVFMFQQIGTLIRKNSITVDARMAVAPFCAVMAVCFALLTVVFWIKVILKIYDLKHPGEEHESYERV